MNRPTTLERRSRLHPRCVRTRILLAGALLSVSTLTAWAQESGEEPPEAPASPALITPPSQPNQPAASPAATPAAGEESAPADVPEGKRLILRAQAAFRRVTSMSYRGKQYANGQLASLLGSFEGTIRMLRRPTPSGSNVPFTWTMNVRGSGSKSNTEFEATWFGLDVEWLDPKEKKLIQKNERSARSPILQSAKYLRVSELLGPEPFSRDLLATAFEIEDAKDVGGVRCDVVLVKSASQSGKQTRWYFGIDDHLPRRMDTITGAAGSNPTTVSFEFLDLVVETADQPGMNEDELRLRLPDGFTEERDPETAIPQASRPQQPPVVQNPGNAVKQIPPGTARPGESPGTQPTVEVAAPPPPPPPALAPEFEMARPSGEKVSLRSMLAADGNQVLLLDFFGTWSIRAKDWHPVLDELAKANAARGVKVVAMGTRERDTSKLVEYLSKAGFNFDLLVDGYDAAKAYGVKTYPSTAVVAKDGRLIRLIAGGHPESRDELASAISAALGSEPASTSPTTTPTINPTTTPDTSPAPADSSGSTPKETPNSMTAEDVEKPKPGEG